VLSWRTTSGRLGGNRSLAGTEGIVHKFTSVIIVAMGGSHPVPGSLDVAAAIIEAPIYVDQLKLQKLLYFAQAWYLAWYDEPMFDDRIEGWERGPAVPRVYGVYGTQHGYGWQEIQAPEAGDSRALDDTRRAALEAVLIEYGDLDGEELERLAKQPPWHNSRVGLSPTEHGNETIPREEMRDFYRRDGSFGPKTPEVRISAETMARIQEGEPGAVADALNEALHAS
jgi:uncharacterized phage-associated protein